MMIAVVACAALASACSNSSTTAPTTPAGTPSSASPTAPVTAGPLDVVRTDTITLHSIQPDDGVDTVVDFIDSAQETLDIAVYQMSPTYLPLLEALDRAKERGVRIRILLSSTIYPPGSANDNPQYAEELRGMGFDAALSRPEFSFSHWKVLVADAGTAAGRALVCDFNLEVGYFGLDPSYPDEGATRGMSVLVTEPKDVDMIAATIDADFPPYKPWPANTRPNLVWSPSDSTCDSVSCASPYPLEPVGNSREKMLSLIVNADKSLDVYAQALAKPSVLLQPLLDALARGVQVRIVGNEGGINTDALQQLKDAGAEIVQNPTDPSGDGKVMYIHTKTIIADRGTGKEVAYVGSINPFLDESVQTERELGVLITDAASLKRILATFERDFVSGTPA